MRYWDFSYKTEKLKSFKTINRYVQYHPEMFNKKAHAFRNDKRQSMVASECRKSAGGQLQQPGLAARVYTSRWEMRWEMNGVGFCNGDSLFVPSLRALDCSNFISVSGWLYRQFFYYRLHHSVKVHWLTIRLCFLITWYSSNTSCFKIFSLTKFSEYNSRTNRHRISYGKEETQYKPSHGQPVPTSWRNYRHKKLIFRLVSIFKVSLAGKQYEKIQINLAATAKIF